MSSTGHAGAFRPGIYNTKSRIARNQFGDVTIEKDLYLERRLWVAGAIRINEYTWEIKNENR